MKRKSPSQCDKLEQAIADCNCAELERLCQQGGDPSLITLGIQRSALAAVIKTRFTRPKQLTMIAAMWTYDPDVYVRRVEQDQTLGMWEVLEHRLTPTRMELEYIKTLWTQFVGHISDGLLDTLLHPLADIVIQYVGSPKKLLKMCED